MSLEHILLGMLREPASGYDLKAAFDASVRHFWAAELSQIYPTLKRLEKERLLSSRTQPSPKGPERKVYSITPRGRAALREWLAAEPVFGDQRLTYLAQLYFMGEVRNLRRTIQFVTGLRERLRREQGYLREVERMWSAQDPAYPDDLPPDDFHAQLTLRMGLITLEARLRWCDETLARLEARRLKEEKQR